MDKKLYDEARARELRIATEHYPKYVHFIPANLSSGRIKMYCRLFAHEITPNDDPEIFNKINTELSNEFNSKVTEYIDMVETERAYNNFIKKFNEDLKASGIPLPKEEFNIDSWERINIYSIEKVKSPGSNNTDYIHVEVEILRGSLEEKIKFAKKYKNVIKFKVYKKLKSRYKNKFNFLKLYDFKFYSKPTVADSGLVIGLLRFEWKEIK